MARIKQSPLVKRTLRITEWETFEVKRAEIAPRKLLENVCAFANNEGGLLVIGVEDPSKGTGKDRLYGISENEDNVSEFLKLVRSEFDPPLQQFISHFEEPINNKVNKSDKLCVVRVQKSDDIHSLKNGDTFVRRGSQNVKIGAQEILRLRYERGSIKFEDEDSRQDELDEIEEDILAQYQKDTGSQGTDKWQFLKDNGLAIRRRSNPSLTNAGALLLAKNPTVMLSRKCSIRVSHYFGTKQTASGEPSFVRRPFTIEGPLLKQIHGVMEYFREAVSESSPKLRGGTFQPSLLIPEWVFQEAIVNAVIHRNYQVQNDIQVRFFDDRIEVESPGSYPAHITASNIRKERFARNPIIQRALSRFQEAPNLDIGEGVDRMFTTMAEHNLYEPIFAPAKTHPNSVLVTLVNMQRINYWDTVSQFLDKNGLITNRQVRDITGIHDTLQVTRLLSDWVSRGLLEKGGGKTRGAYYVKAGQDILTLFFKGPEK